VGSDQGSPPPTGHPCQNGLKYGGLFIEGKTTSSRLTVGVARGGHADVTEQSAHLVGGITLTMP
jgi:hypothetical protein